MGIPGLYKIFLGSDGVTTDSRSAAGNKMFFALRGDKFDGHSFVNEVMDGGCKVAVIDDSSYSIPGKTVLVDDVLRTLQELSKYHRDQLRMPVFAITGSNGKTTTKELISAVLSVKFKICATKGNLNNHIGVPLTLLEVRSTDQIAIVEMGANHIGEIDALCEIAKPTHGLITNIGSAHLEGFGSPGGVIKAKSELFRYLKRTGGVIFVNSDSAVIKKIAGDLAVNGVQYGSEEGLHISGQLTGSDNGIELKIKPRDHNEWINIRSQLPGSYNYENIIAAASVGIYFGVSATAAGHAIQNYIPGNNRSQLSVTRNNRLLLDAYNANPDSMRAALENFAAIRGQNKAVILGDMLELSRYTEDEHKKIIDLLARMEFREVILVGELFSRIPVPANFTRFSDVDNLIGWLKNNPLRDRFILLKGSRGLKLERCAEYL